MAISDDQKATNVNAFSKMIEFCHREGHEAIPLDNDYSFKMTTPMKGQWYLAITCGNCGHDTPVFPDKTNGAWKGRLDSDRKLQVNCYNCGKQAESPARTAKFVQWGA